MAATMLAHHSTVARSRRLLLKMLLALSLVVVALAVLTPHGHGWSWGSPLTELRWYATDLSSDQTRVQLLGNLVLLAPTTVLATALWPPVAAPERLVTWGVGAGTAIETLQRLLPIGRVVSPVDALLNATGVVISGHLAARVHEQWRAPLRTHGELTG